MVDERIVAGLQESLVAEFYASMCMFVYAHNVRGLTEYDIYNEYFLEGWEEEGEHMKKCADHLQGYGVPVKIPAIEVEPAETVEQMLEHQYHIEVWAIERYNRLTVLCDEIGDKAMANFFQDLAEAEENDRKAVVKRLGRQPDMADGMKETLPADPMAA